jgi:hypothetical protein
MRRWPHPEFSLRENTARIVVGFLAGSERHATCAAKSQGGELEN